MSGVPPRVIVIGAGIVGLCTAFHLRRGGAEVAVIDRSAPGAGCSSGSAGSLSPGSVVPLGMPGVLRAAPQMLFDPESPLHVPLDYAVHAIPWLLRFALASRPSVVDKIAKALVPLVLPTIKGHRDILTEIGGLDLLVTTGQLHVYKDEKSFSKDRPSWDLRRRLGVRFKTIDSGGVHEMEPDINTDYSLGVFLPEYGFVTNPLRYAQLLARTLAQRDVRFISDEVVALKPLVDGGINVVGKQAVYHAVQIVVSTGAWSAELLAPLGYRIPLESQRGYHQMFGNPGVTISRPIIAADTKVFASPMEDGLRIAGTVEFGGLQRPPTPQRLAMLLEQGKRIFPKLNLASERTEWMGNRPCLPDSLPVLGPSHRHKGLWFNFGQGHLGLTMAAQSAEMLAGAMLSRSNESIDLASYDVERFAFRPFGPKLVAEQSAGTLG